MEEQFKNYWLGATIIALFGLCMGFQGCSVMSLAAKNELKTKAMDVRNKVIAARAAACSPEADAAINQSEFVLNEILDALSK